MEKVKVGIQLYSLRDEMAKDMDATLKKVAEAGYTDVEFAGFFDKEAEEVKDILDKYSLTARSVHQKIDPYLEKDSAKELIAYLKKIGVTDSIIPWYDPKAFEDLDLFKDMIKKFTEVGKILADNGMTLGYHNHNFEFFHKFGSSWALDAMYNEISADYLLTELDLCWVKYGAQDPVEYLKKYAKRMNFVHFKDFTSKTFGGEVYALIDEKGKEIAPKNRDEDDFKFMPLGQGVQVWEPIIAELKNTNAHTVIYEKDQWYDGDAIQEAVESRNFLKKLGL